MGEKLYFQWHITDACNYRCRHCYQEDFTKASELALPSLVKIYENIASCAGGRKISINLTGGEPFMRRDFFDLLNYLDGREETDELMIITNASLIDDETIRKLERIKKLSKIKISLDGATDKTNDRIRRPGAFKIALEKINLIQEKTGFEIIIMTTIMNSNLYELPAFFQLCDELKVDGLIIERFIPLGQSSALKAEVISRDGWKRVVRDICEYTEADLAEDEALACKAFWMRFKDGDVELLRSECNLGKDAFAIMPNADLYPCRRFAMKIGNLLDKSLSDIIGQSRVLKEVADKSKLKGKCRSCRVDNCRGCRALAYSVGKDYLAEDGHCWI